MKLECLLARIRMRYLVNTAFMIHYSLLVSEDVDWMLICSCWLGDKKDFLAARGNLREFEGNAFKFWGKVLSFPFPSFPFPFFPPIPDIDVVLFLVVDVCWLDQYTVSIVDDIHIHSCINTYIHRKYVIWMVVWSYR